MDLVSGKSELFPSSLATQRADGKEDMRGDRCLRHPADTATQSDPICALQLVMVDKAAARGVQR
jgi:hypothetical protein